MTSAHNYYVEFHDGHGETLAGVIFFGVQDGHLLFAHPSTVKPEGTSDLPPVAPTTVRVSADWQSEGNESVGVTALRIAEVAAVSTDWSSLHAGEDGSD